MVKAAATPSKSPAPAKKASTPAAQAQAAASSTPGRGHRRSHSQSDMAASPTATLTPNAASAAAASAARKRIRIESTETPTKSTKSPQNTAKNAVAKALPKRMVQADENEDDDDEEDDDTDLMALAADDDDDDDDDEAEADDDNDDDDDGDALDEASTDMDVSDANLDADLTDPRFVARRRAPLPTADEMRQLRESQSLYKGNLFRMQIEELLTQVKLNYSKHKTLEAALLSLKQQIESMPSDKSEREVSAADFAKLGVVPPLYATAASSIKFQFQTPSSFALVGSYNLRVLTKPNMTVDVAVEMPAGMFQAKDNINYRYHHKRALFLARIAARLKATAEFANVHFALAFDSDLSRPILSVRPQYAGTNQQSQFTIRIFPAVSAAVFKLSKLTPERNNARAFKIFGDDATAGGADADDANAGVPTPLYNSTILMDMMFSAHLAEIHAVLSQSTSGALSNGLVLFKVWLRVAHLDKHFSGLQAAFLLCYLYSGKRVTKFMTAIQVFRVMLEFIAQTDLTETPLAMPSNVDSKPDLALFQQVFPITLVDASGFLNVFYSISRSQYDEIRHQARIAASSFDAVGCDPYEILFQVRAQPEIKFDHTFVIHPLPGAAVTLASSTREVVQDAFLQANGNYAQHIAKTLHSLLVRGLSDRVQLVTVTPVLISADATQSDLQSTEWGCNEAGPAAVHLGAWDMAPFGSRKPSKANASSSASSSKGPSFALRVGIVAHSEQSLRVVDMGPSADDAEAAGAFRALWREKAELRRFKDGRVCEAVVWQSYPVSQRHLLVRDIVLHLAAVHLSLQGPQTSAPNVHIHHTANQLDHLLAPMRWALGAHRVHNSLTQERDAATKSAAAGDSRTLLTSSACEDEALSRTRAILGTLDGLSRIIRNMHDLPLSVATVQPLASTFRYADVFPPQPVVGANMPSTVAFPVLATMNSSVASDDAKARVSWIPALEVMLQFESSSRWPSTLDAMQKVKTAFLIKLAEALATRKPPSAETPDAVAAAAHKKSKKAQRAEESSEDAEDKEDDPEAHLLFAGKGIPSLLSADHLDVCVDGIVFRLFVYHEKEAQLIRVWDRQRQRKRGLGSMTVEVATEDADNEQDGADAAEENASKLLPTLFPEGVTAVAYERFFTQRALHTSVIHSFATLHPFFMPTVRLAKRWLAAHLLSENFTDECVELLVVRVFIHSHPYDEPASPLVGLLRFLSLLATFDFFQQAVIVDVVADSAEHSRFTEEEVSNVETHFRNNRAALPALFISTQTDRQSSQWTLEGPSAGMLSRAATFARACLEMLTRCIRNPFSTDASFVSAFRTNLQDYDIIIHLKPVQVPRLYSSINAEEYLPLFVRPSKYKNIALSATLSAASFAARGESSLLVAFDPVGRFVAELQRLFSEYAIFSFDKYGGTIVAVALKPAAFSPRALSTNHALATMPAIRAKTLRPLPGVTSDPANQVVANIDALLEDFEEVGQGLVDRIEVQRKLW